MCEFCTKHGEGKKWYLNAKNYSSDLLEDLRRRRYVKEFFYHTDKVYRRYFGLVKMLPFDLPLIGAPLREAVKRIFIDLHWGQVVPIEDIAEILSRTNTVTRIPCVCRKITAGTEARTCFLISMDPSKAGPAQIMDASYFGGPDVSRFETVSREVALEFMRLQEQNGLFHSIWTLGSPFIAAICNCDHEACIAMRIKDAAAPIFFKAEYAVRLDRDVCTGCRRCVRVCPFKALSCDAASRKAVVAQDKCYGCGICRSVCKAGALTMQDRDARAAAGMRGN